MRNPKRKMSRSILFPLLAILLLSAQIFALTGCRKPETPDKPDTPEEDPGKEDKPIPAILTVDQTRHPEVSAADADVEALLKSDESYNYKKDYEVFFKAENIVAENADRYPNIVFHETPAENGLSFRQAAEEPLEFLNLKDRDCWLFVHLAKKKTNQFSLKLADDMVEKYAGGDVVLNFSTYVANTTKFQVEYYDVNGVKQTAEAKTMGKNNTWTEIGVTLNAPAFGRGIDGYDLYVTCTGPEIIRINTAWLTPAADVTTSQTGLIEGKFGGDSYIVADVNVLAFGARGDGRADDTAAFTAAINTVKDMGGGTVFVPAGYYCLTSSLSLPIGVGLVGELQAGTANGTVLCVYGGKGKTDASQAAVRMAYQSAVKNIAFWYPEQTFVNGRAIPYPPTILQTGSEGVTVQNVTFVNAYFGINYAAGGGNNSLQYTRDVYGTCLAVGYENDHSYDIGKIENLNLAASYWLDSGLPGTPNAKLLETYLKRNATGVVLERIDWTYLADVTVKGYYIGVRTDNTGDGSPNGHMYHFDLLDCYYCLKTNKLNWLIATACTFRATGDRNATAIMIPEGCGGVLSFNSSTIESEGLSAVMNYGTTQISMTDCTLTSKLGAAYDNVNEVPYTMVNTKVSDHFCDDHNVEESAAPDGRTKVDYGRTVVTKPASTAMINLTEAPYNAKKDTDITAILQKAIDDLKTTGGTVYLPAGTYTVSAPIEVHAGIEIRGAAYWAQNMGFTTIQTQYGEDNPDGTALFTLHDGAGMRGLSVLHPNQWNTKELHSYPFVIRGNGKNVYVVDVCLPTAWNGVDFATYRCDNHYVEYLWGVFLNVGVQVGAGSENGIIRDCHFTPNSWALRALDSYWGDVFYSYVMTQSRPFVVGESENEILYHNFTYGAYLGLDATYGANNVFLLCHGVDAGNISAHFSGDCNVTMVDCQLVNLHGKDMRYIVTEPDFCGEVTTVNMACWGPTAGALWLRGRGDFQVYGGIIVNAGTQMVQQDGENLWFCGLINQTATMDFVLGRGAQDLHISGNLYANGLDINEKNSIVEISGSDYKK